MSDHQENIRWGKWDQTHRWRRKFARRRSPIIILGLLIIVIFLMWRIARYGIGF